MIIAGLFHVAITRASAQVVVVPSESPSPFIAQCSTAPRQTIRSAGPAPVPGAATPRTKAPPVDAPPLDGHLSVRFEALRAWRRSVAGTAPAYTVFSDAVLRDIALHRPTSLAELGRRKGIGATKLERYGADVLRVLDVADGRPS